MNDDGDEYEGMVMDENGWWWIKMDETVFKWIERMKMDGNRWWWMKMDENGWWWMVMDEGGWWWMKKFEKRCECMKMNVKKVTLYNSLTITLLFLYVLFYPLSSITIHFRPFLSKLNWLIFHTKHQDKPIYLHRTVERPERNCPKSFHKSIIIWWWCVASFMFFYHMRLLLLDWNFWKTGSAILSFNPQNVRSI